MSKMMKKSLALIALLLVASTAAAQQTVFKKPVLAPQVKPALPPAVLKTPITAVNAITIVSNSPNREEAARRLKAQNVPVAVALAALSNAFTGASGPSTLLALRSAGYATPDLVVALKQGRSLSAASMVHAMAESGIPAAEWIPSMRQLYTLDFDTLLAEPPRTASAAIINSWFGYALDVMGYNVEQMVQTGYRYFNGRFSSPASGGQPYPGPGELYMLLKNGRPIAEHHQIDHYALWAMMINAGYQPTLLMKEIRFARYEDRTARPLDDIAQCLVQTNLVFTEQDIHNSNSRSGINPQMTIQIAPDGSASHSDAQRGCYVQFLERLRREGLPRTAAVQMAEYSLMCLPEFNPTCPARVTEVAARIVTEAYPEGKN